MGDAFRYSKKSIAENQFANSEVEFNKWSPWNAAEQADLSRTPVMIVSGLLVDFADRYTAFLEGLPGGQVTRRYTEDCRHEMKGLASARGEDAFEFFGKMLA